jgi:hypothetical protein
LHDCAVGPDDISAELFKAGGSSCASQLWELINKIWEFAYWPFEWRGGRLCEVFKKGDKKICDNFRGLLISDHMGKAAAGILYDGVDAAYHEYVPQEQCGAVRHKDVDFATHLLRTMLDHAEAWGLSIAILFIDLVKAFDRLLRESVLGWSQLEGQRGLEYLKELGFSESHALELEREINNGAVLAEINVHPHVVALLASMHTKSWFQVGGSTEYLVVHKGGRQGCRFGGIIFNLSYAKALKIFYAKVNAEGIPARFRYEPGAAPGNDDVPPGRAGEAIVFDVTFVDDEAIVITASVPVTLIGKLKRTISLLVETFDHYGMTINWKPGKTEAMIVLRRKKAKAEKSKLANNEHKRTLTVTRKSKRLPRKTPREETEIGVNVVSSYKHLGCIVDASRNLVPEARNRERSAMNSFVPLATRVLGSKMLGVKRRIQLAWSLIMSRLFFGVHTWSTFGGRPRTILYGLYMRVWRRVIGDPRFQKTRWNDLEVRQLLEVPSLDCYARKRRLMYWSRLTRSSFDALHAVLQARNKFGKQLPWIRLLVGDLKVLKSSLPEKLSEMPNPDVDIDAYWQLAKNYPVEWRDLIKLYFTVHEDTTNTVERGCEPRGETHGPSFECNLCGQLFGTFKGMSVHKWAKHKIKNDVRRFIGDVSACPVSSVDFRSRGRLVKHLAE